MSERRFGKDAGGKEVVVKQLCIEEVWPRDRWSVPYQCTRRRGHGKDGLYCKQHAKLHEPKE